MKKINLIGWLSRNSHEKQSPQRFARYAAMLIMLLTLGVGQMWADNAGFWDIGAGIITYSKNGGSDTNHSVNMTGSSTSDFGTVTAFWLKGWQFKMWKSNDGNVCDFGKLCYRIYLTSESGGSYTELNKDNTQWNVDGNNIYHNGGSLNTNLLSGLVGGEYYFEFYFKAQGNWSSSSGCDDKYLSNGGSNYKIKFKYDPKYTVTVSAGSNGSVASTSVTAGNIDAVTLPTATANTGYHFNNWTTASSNLTLGNTTSATTGTVKARAAGTVTANFAANTYTVAYNANDDQYSGTATGSTSSSSHTYGTAKALTSNGFSRAGYTFAGWATTPTGSVAYTNGQSVTNLTSTQGATVTLYAKWLPQSLTITSHPTYLTTTDKLNLSISYENIPEGYCYRVKELRTGGYYNSEAHGTYDPISSTGSTTYTSSACLPLGADRIVLELWKGTPGVQQTVVSNEVAVTVEPGWEVGVQAQTDGVISTAGGTVSPASVSPTEHIGRTITAEAKVGYDFKGWTANTLNITFADASELSTTVKATAGGTVYANFAKQSSSYTTTFYAGDHGSINAKGTAIAKNGSASVTIGENETLSATPESAEYVFDHWGTTGSVSVANIYSATTTVTATAAGGTVTAYYRHIPVLGAVTATPSGTQNYAGSPIDFALSVTSTYMAHPVVVFLVNDGTTTYEVVGAPYGADGSSAAGTIGSDAANTTVHKATFTASAAKSYTVSAKLYEGLLVENFETANYTTWENVEGGTFSTVTNPYQQAGNGSSHVKQITPNGENWKTALTRTTSAWNNEYQYIHAKMYYQGGTDLRWKINDAPTELVQTIGATSTWQDVAFNNSGRATINFMFPFVAGQTNTFYIDDIILSNEASMTEKASQAATASFSINWNYTVTLNNNGATSAGTESVNVTYGSATGITNITVPTKTGYTFGGYYTEDAGAGTLQINASGVWQNAGYVSGGNWNSGSNQTLYAKWTEKMTTVTISASPAGTGTFTVNSVAGSSASVGVTTTKSIVAVPHADYTWTSWTATNCSVSPTNNKSTTLSGDGSSSTGTLVGTFTQVPCTLWYHTSSATFAEKTGQIIMSYDLEEDAYYADVASTPSSPYYFRFYHNGATQYSADWDGSYPNVQTAVVNGSKISCTNVSDWGSKSSIKYVGNSGTSIRIWFDYQSKKAWITADKDNQYVLRGYKYDDSGAGGMPGWSATTTYFDGLASGNTGTITATLNAATKYKFKVYDRFFDTWYGYSTSGSEHELTDGVLSTTGTGTNNNFYFTTTIAGTYTFTVDKSSGLKVKVDFPVSYQLNYDIGTVKGNNGSISTDPTTASGSYVPSGNSVELTAPEAKTGYTWKGWYTDAAGTEGNIPDVNRVITVTMNADKTLYACYTENEYPVTVSTGANGDVSPKGTVNVKQISGTSLTATPSSGYHFDHWAISGGGITPSSSTTSPQTFKATETGGTIQAIFAETTYSVNVNSGNSDFGSVSTTSVSGIGIATYSDEITATPETGATFTGWTLPDGVTAAAGYTSASNPIRIHASASGKAITANFSETKHTATITTENDDYGTVSPTSASVGQITAVQITASKKTGYMFAGWEQTAGSGTVTYHVAAGAGSSVDPTGNTQSITYITIDGDVTLQATWEEDRSAGWFLRGEWPDGWSSTGQKAFIKNVGETAGTVSYVRWTLAPEMFTNATMQMKMYDGSTYYGHSTEIDAAGNLCTKDANNTNIQFYDDNSYKNFKVSIPVAGEYIFKWDSSTKQLTITYPAGNFIRGTFDSWSWDHVLEPTGNANEYSCVISMTGDKAPHAWTGSDGFKVVLAGDHYGKNSSGVTRASNSASGLDREGANINWTTDVRGDYTFTVNSSSKTVTVTYPNAYTVTYGYGAGGSSVSASATSVGGTFSSGAYVAAGDDITFTQTAVDGNTFNGWYNAASGGDAISCMASDNVYDNIAGNINVYAQYIPTTYTNITLNATTGSTNGAYSVTFGGTTITVTTDPVKTGYEPEGFYESYADGKWTNKIAASNGTLQSGTTYTDATGHWTSTASPTLYTKWQPKTYGLTLDKNGSSAGYLTNGSVTTTYDSNTLTSLIAPTRTGYHIIDGYYKEPGLTNKIITVGGALCASTDYTDASSNWTNDGAVSLYAKWAPNTYTITFAPAGGSVDPTSASVTFDAAISNAPVPTRTGYTFTGYNTAGGASITTNGGVFKSSVDGFTDGSAHWIQPDDATITAQWTPDPYTITLTQSTETGYGSAGTAFVTATYDAALPTIDLLPTAANGYAFMGYYTAKNGGGTQYYDATGTRLVATYTTADDLELFAYFKKAEITELVASPGVIAPGETITVTPTIEPTPTGTTKVCWEVQYSNGTPLPSQPTFTSGAGNAVSFPVPSASATYIIQATLAKGSSCPADPGDVLSTRTTTFQVAGEHTVTIRYQDSEGRTLQASASIEARPLDWTTLGNITPPTITGYTFVRWDAGDGVTIENGDSDPVTTTTTSSIQIKATYDGTLTAVYSKKRMIYFNNTLGWGSVYVYFYKNDSYWNNDKGTGANTSDTYTDTPYSEGLHGEMTQIEGTNIFYFDAEAAGVNASYINVAFTELDQHGYHYFAKTGDVKNKVIRRGDYSTTLPMFVPLEGIDPTEMNDKLADYYNKGYWMNYPENTGYTLHIYDSKTYGSGSSMQVIPFEFNGDKTMPMTVKVELNANREYGYEIHRADGNVYGNDSKVLKINDSGEEDPEGLTASQRGGIQTSVAGDYEFTLNYGEKGVDTYKYLIGVHYPVAANDYRIVYTDQTAWSKATHTSGWYHPSRAIHKEEGSKDIVSFYVSKAGGANAGMKFQYASAIEPSTGVVTWTDVPSGTIDLSGITESGVYNFHLTQDASSISVEKIEPYNGNYYIRTDCAGNSKWENFRTSDHQMTYSDYAETNSGYSHYYTHWVTSGTNVKFCIANDYSQCITDTLTQDYGTVIANIDAAGALNSASANIRFMWNQSTNKVSRAYIGGSTNISDRFLVLEGDSKMYDKDGSALNISGLNPNEANLIDDQNFVYEREIQVNTKARAKLTAKYNNNIQYFKGSEGAFAEGTTIELLGGDASGKHTMRIVYDFKTNRLVTAYIPSGTIEDNIAINADLMIVREHQEAGQQLLFNGGSLSKVHTVYGVMRFNRWTLNNKNTTEPHGIVADPKSAYERGLYWISFPFDVNLSDVFGFGTYGTHWIIMEYDGAARATEGYWADSEGFWKYVMPSQRATYELKAGKGYVLALDLDLMRDNDETFWTNNIEQVELFFPSAAAVNNIQATNITTSVDSHECTIDRTNNNGSDINKNRTRADSHWNIIGIPSYANYGSTLKKGKEGDVITWNSSPYTNDLPFLYEWSAVDNSYAVQSGTTYPFKAMHAYMVQYHGDLYWSLASATPPSIVARSTYAEKPESVEMRLELQQNEMKVDQTFVKLSNDENASANFAFDEDLCKEFNANKANIYTIVENYLPVAGNTMPMSEQTTVVPVGVKIAADGDYTFAIPDGMEGIGVTLIDNETGIRTSLTALEYTINLSAGEYADRFILEISPISQISTDVESISDEGLEIRGARKIMIDGLLYIVKDGKLFDAQGRRL